MSLVQEFLNWNWASIGSFISGDLTQEISAQVAVLAEEAAKNMGEEVAKKSAATITAMASKAAAEKASSLWQSVGWRRAEQGYRDRLREYVNTTRLLGNPKPVQIDQLYTDIFVYEQSSAFRRSTLKLADPAKDPYTFDEPYERKDALDLARKGNHLYMLGHPGAGKTTFLKYLAILACTGKLNRTPIYIPLRDVVQLKLTVAAYVEREFDICGFPNARQFVEKLLTKSDTLLLIDGLDEVPDASDIRTAVILEITELARRHPRSQLMVTCRIAASDYAFQQFTYCEVAQFTLEQQKTFIKKWYSTEDEKGTKLLSEWDQLRVAPLRDLAKTPLLLALICLAFDELHELPERHVDLYRDALETLLRKWDSSRNIRRDPFYAGLSANRREQLLQELASKFHGENRILFSSENAAPIVDGWFKKLPDPPKYEAGDTSDLIAQIEAQHGLIVKRAAGIYSFSHLSLQEFFTARSISLAHPVNTIERIVSNHATEPRWREVFIFLAGLLPDGAGLLEQLYRNAAKGAIEDSVVRMFLAQVMGDYRKREPFWRSEIRPLRGWKTIAYAGKSPVLRMLDMLGRRLDSVKWLGQQSGLHLKAQIAEEMLIAAESDSQNSHVRALMSTEFMTYLQAAVLTIDCASVAVCDNRERAVSWILTPMRS